MQRVRELVDRVFRRRRRDERTGGKDNEGCCGGDGGDDDEYKVHMAVLTACLGKRVPVAHGNLMATTLRQAIESKPGGSIRFLPRSEENCNNEIFQITNGWGALWACCRDIVAARSCGGDSSATSAVDLSDEAMPPGEHWKNTVTVYARGTVIIRISWKKSILWRDDDCDCRGKGSMMQGRVLNACKAICLLVGECC